MSTDIILLVVFGVFLILLVCETPIAWALAAAGALGISLMRGPDLVTSMLGTSAYRSTASYTLAIIPMYLLLGMFALHGRLAERLYQIAAVGMRRLPGGLGVATVGACAGFAAVCGSSVATAATIGKVSIGEMRKYGYPAPFAAGIVASAGTLGILIPPSIVIVIYGVLAQESIARLLVAGILPGIFSAVVMAAYIIIRGRTLNLGSESRSLEQLLDDQRQGARRSTPRAHAPGEEVKTLVEPQAGTVAPAALPEVGDPNKVTGWQAIRAVIWVSIIFAVVMTGIYSGYFTVIESGALAAVVGLVMLIVENRSLGTRRLFRKLYDSTMEATDVTSMAFAILIGATMLSTFLVMSRVPMTFTDWVLGLDAPPLLIVLILLLALVPLGMFLDTLSILIITVPLMHPVVVGLGYDGIWFAILVVKMIEMGMVTPPVGMNVFVVSGASGIPVEQVFRGVLPFVLVEFVIIGALIAFPGIILWLPSMVTL